MNYVIQNKFKINTERNSKGCQIKYKRGDYWYKIDSSCNEGSNEHIASIILKCTNLKDYVYYERCLVNNKKGCRSHSFLNNTETFITIGNIIKSVYGVSSADDFIWGVYDIKARFEKIVKATYIYTGYKLNITNYLAQLFYFDMLILNRDRHLNNLGIIVSDNGEYRFAPIFDNGLSLLGGCQGIIYEKGIEEVISKQSSRTISGSFVQQALVSTNGELKCPFKIDFKKLSKVLSRDKYLSNIQKDLLKYQYGNIGKIYM